MAISATQILERHPECYETETLNVSHDGRDAIEFSGLHFTRETAVSVALDQVSGGAIIMVGSGMCKGGRVRRHSKHILWRQNISVVFVCHAGEHIIDGAKRVRIFVEEIRVCASIHTIGGFSVHADQAEILVWHDQAGRQK